MPKILTIELAMSWNEQGFQSGRAMGRGSRAGYMGGGGNQEKVLHDHRAGSAGKRHADVIEDLAGHLDDFANAMLHSQGIRNKCCSTNLRSVGPCEKAVEKSKKTTFVRVL
ncbi:hypothetical protein E3N88_40258 [Mikania micrantha]|uniref:Uncharacterized protein n=1 Tax=Mikania micrantha TaxID=192012 RepID=A0A5N6LMZ1_9ASTR|nr:hypothetical protein E3N88_40258 [Mikania micrantha]